MAGVSVAWQPAGMGSAGGSGASSSAVGPAAVASGAGQAQPGSGGQPVAASGAGATGGQSVTEGAEGEGHGAPVGGWPAAVGAKVVLTREQVKSRRPFVTAGWNDHNTALKYFRDNNEMPPGVPTVDGIDLTETAGVDVLNIRKQEGWGEWYEFHQADGYFQWDWRDMLASFDDQTLDRILFDNEDNGVVNVSLRWFDVYDHKRAAAYRKRGVRMGTERPKLWDFVVTLLDGTAVRFHPSRLSGKSRKKVVEIGGTREGGWAADRPGAEIPKTGSGGTSGRGTFAAAKRANYASDERPRQAQAAPNPPEARPAPPPPRAGAPAPPLSREGAGLDATLQDLLKRTPADMEPWLLKNGGPGTEAYCRQQAAQGRPLRSYEAWENTEKAREPVTGTAAEPKRPTRPVPIPEDDAKEPARAKPTGPRVRFQGGREPPDAAWGAGGQVWQEAAPPAEAWAEHAWAGGFSTASGRPGQPWAEQEAWQQPGRERGWEKRGAWDAGDWREGGRHW